MAEFCLRCRRRSSAVSGGYLMRVYKTVTLGADLQRCYDKAARADTSEMRESLQRIELHLSERAHPPAYHESPE